METILAEDSVSKKLIKKTLNVAIFLFFVGIIFLIIRVVLATYHYNKYDYYYTTMTQVPFVLKFAGYDVDKNLLKEIFGSSGSKRVTAKSLRNAVTHGIDEKAVKQIADRKDELFGYMDEFLNLIKSSD